MILNLLPNSIAFEPGRHDTLSLQFYIWITNNSKDLNHDLEKWECIFNNIRPHRVIDILSPSRYIEHHYPHLILGRLSHIY